MARSKINKFPLIQAISSILLIACGLLAVLLGVRAFISIRNIIHYMNNGVTSMAEIPVNETYKGIKASPTYMLYIYFSSLALYIATAVFCTAGPFKTRLRSFQMRWNILALVSLLLQLVIIAADIGIHKARFSGFFAYEPFYYYIAVLYAILSLFPLVIKPEYVEYKYEEYEKEETAPVKLTPYNPVTETIKPVVASTTINNYYQHTVSYIYKGTDPVTYVSNKQPDSLISSIPDNPADFKRGMRIDIAPLDRYNLCFLRHNHFIDAKDFSNGVRNHYRGKPYVVTLR